LSAPCKVLCHHNLHRFHFSCFYCRIRRYFLRKRGVFGLFGKMDRKKYHYNRFLGAVLPNNPADTEAYTFFLSDTASYTIIIDKTRKLAKIKDILLKRLLLIAEKHETLRNKLTLLTFCEGLAN
jgi:hypothetical protein